MVMSKVTKYHRWNQATMGIEYKLAGATSDEQKNKSDIAK